MTTPVYVPELDGSRIYKVGRVGYETGTEDAGRVYTGLMRSEKISPQGEAGWCRFRRVVLRVRHTSTFTCAVRVYVDGVQTTVYDQTDMLTGATVLQEVTFAEEAPSNPPDEVILQVDVIAKGTYIEVELECDSDDVAGTFLPESLEVHYVPVRGTRQGDATA